MRPRIAFTGCLAGLIAGQLLLPVFTNFFPGYIAPEFSRQAPTRIIVLLLCFLSTLVILAGGYITARLEWAKTWQRAISCGFNTGLLAGCLAYMFSGAAAAAGILGQKEILLSLNAPIASESAGIGLLAQGVINTAVWTQVLFWVLIIPSLALGVFGGLLSLFEKSPGLMAEPASKKPDLERLVVYCFGAFGVLNLVVFMAVMNILPGITQKAILENNSPTSGILAPPSFIMILPLVTISVGLIPCLILSIKWALEAWNQPNEHFRVKVWLWIIGIFALLLLFVNLYFALVIMGLFAGLALLISIWVFRQQGKSMPPPAKPYQAYTPLDFIASAITQGILGGTLTTITMVAYSLSLVLIAIVNIPHLTLSGVVESTASEQILFLYTTISTFNLTSLIVASIVGLIIAGIGGATGILRSSPAKTIEVTEASNLIDE